MMRCGQMCRAVRPPRYVGLGSTLRPGKERGAFVRWFRPAAVKRVCLPASFPAELSQALYPLALRAALEGRGHLEQWGLSDQDTKRLEAASDTASQVSESDVSTGSSRSVQFGQM